MRAGNYTEAADAYSRAIEADPSVAAFWSNRSAARLKAGDVDGSCEDATEAVRLKPEWTKAHHRLATALDAMGKHLEAATACDTALAASSDASDTKLFTSLKDSYLSAAATQVLQGWWHGTVSDTLGGYEQEFSFLNAGVLKCTVYGNEMPGTYVVKDVVFDGGFRGGLDVNLNSQEVPYLFRVRPGCPLDLCCPMSRPERPRTFDGPGFVHMLPGRSANEGELEGLSEGQRIVRYLTELVDTLESLPTGVSGTSDETCEKLEELGQGTVSSTQVMGQESLDDKEKSLKHEQRMEAIRVKYGETEALAQTLIKGEVRAVTAYPTEAKDIDRLLRRFQQAD